MKLRAKATDLPAQKEELVTLVKMLRKTLKARLCVCDATTEPCTHAHSSCSLLLAMARARRTLPGADVAACCARAPRVPCVLHTRRRA
jgi:hypothetical protein